MAADRRGNRLARVVGSVRLRAAFGAGLIMAVALAVAGTGLVLWLHRSQVGSLTDSARLRADDVAALAATGTLPAVLPSPPGDVAFTQVVDDTGQVVAATPNIEGQPAVSDLVPPRSGIATATLSGGPVGDSGQYVLVARRADTSGQGTYRIYVAAALDVVNASGRATVAGLLVVGPALVALVVAATWLLVGRSLQPVERIRREVAEITARRLDRRVPEPPSHDEISRLAVTMNEMLERIEAGAASQRRFIDDASHELRSPLAAARVNLEVARAHPDAADWSTVATESLADLERVEWLTADLLALARLDSHAAEPRREPVDLAQIAHRAALFAPRAVPIDLRQLTSAPCVGDPDQLERVVANLLDNATRHASSSVSIHTATLPDAAVLTVTDDGPGVPAGDRERVFERFTRLDEARDRARGGTGLGLAIVREIVEAHGGTVGFEDSAVGARVTVRLPRA